MIDPDERRFWRWADRNQSRPVAAGMTTHCWIWCGSRNTKKQPLWSVGSKTVSPIKWLWLRTTGRTVPPGMQLQALCRVSMCVRPDHHEPMPRGTRLPTPAVRP